MTTAFVDFNGVVPEKVGVFFVTDLKRVSNTFTEVHVLTDLL